MARGAGTWWWSRATRGCAVVFGAVVMLLAVPVTGEAQERDTVRRDTVQRDTVQRDTAILIAPVLVPQQPPAPARRRITPIRAPISPRRAFLSSFLVPGLAQSRLDRTSSGALFATVEMGAFAMLRRSAANVRAGTRYGVDTLPGNFTVDPETGELAPSGITPPRADADLERSRRLQVEDWIAVIAFNHLLSGADAFVSAQLWDVPVRVNAIPTPQGAMLVASFRW